MEILNKSCTYRYLKFYAFKLDLSLKVLPYAPYVHTNFAVTITNWQARQLLLMKINVQFGLLCITIISISKQMLLVALSHALQDN